LIWLAGGKPDGDLAEGGEGKTRRLFSIDQALQNKSPAAKAGGWALIE